MGTKFIEVIFLGTDVTETYGICRDLEENIYLVDVSDCDNVDIGDRCSVTYNGSFVYGFIPF